MIYRPDFPMQLAIGQLSLTAGESGHAVDHRDLTTGVWQPSPRMTSDCHSVVLALRRHLTGSGDAADRTHDAMLNEFAPDTCINIVKNRMHAPTRALKLNGLEIRYCSFQLGDFYNVDVTESQ